MKTYILIVFFTIYPHKAGITMESGFSSLTNCNKAGVKITKIAKMKTSITNRDKFGYECIEIEK